MYVLVLAFVLIANLANATTYYVSTTGNDSNNGLTLDTPKRKVSTCAALLTAGDTCYARGGTYTGEGTIRLGVTGTSSAPIKLLNYPGERPIISYSSQVSTNRILVEPSVTQPPTALGYITIEGFEILGGWEGIKFTNMHNSVIRRNTIHDGFASGIFGAGGHHNRFEGNIIYHQGDFAGCAAGTASCNQQHGMYMHGDSYTIINNVIYDNIGAGIQQNGYSTSSYTTTRHPGPEFAGSKNWIVSDNTFAYQRYASGHIVWSSSTDNTRIENNICYENKQAITGGNGGQCVFFTGAGAPGITIRNNHAYATSPGTTSFIGTSGGAVEGVGYTQSGNVVNVSAPAFVSAGATISGTPDFRLTASAPVNIARANEFLNNGIVGAFKTTPAPTASLHGQTVTYTFASTTPIQVTSSTGASINCTGTDCPGPLTVGSASVVPGADTQAGVVINGIPSNACIDPVTDPDQAWTGGYNSATGSWTSSDNIGAYPGLNQQLFSFTSLAIANHCDGTGPPGTVGTPYIAYNFDEGTGTSLTNTGSSGAGDNGTRTNGPPWVPGKTGTAVLVEAGTNQKIDVPHGNAIDPTSTTVMWVLAVNVPSGSEGATHFVIGPSLGTNQRAYLCGHAGTWKISIQNVACQSQATSNLTVDAGYNFLTVTFNAATDTVTVTKNGVTGTGGATSAYASFAFASDVTIGRLNENSGSGLTIEDFAWYTTAEDPVALYEAWNAPAVSVGTFGMPSYRFQAVYLPELGGSPTNFGTAINQPKDVVAGGAVALLAEIYCENVADCELDSFGWEAQQNGTGSYIQIPDMETATHIWMWGPDNNTLLNSGITTSRLSASSCAVTNGVTILTSAQVHVFDLPQDGCVVLRGIFRIGATASGYYNIRLSQQNGTPFTGTVNPARINVIGTQGSAF